MPNQAAQNLLDLQNLLGAAQSGPNESGLITGPIQRRKRLAREAEANQQASIVAQQQGANLLQASGINFQDVQPDRVTAIQGLLADPGTRQQGLDELDQITARQGFSQTPLQLAQLEQVEQSRIANLAQQGRQENAARLAQEKIIFQSEGEFRGEFQNAVGPAIESQQVLNLAQSQMALGTPSGAFNTARLFVRQLDQSMFASDELTAQMNQSGVAGHIANLESWLSGGGVFDEAARKSMVESMAAINQVFQNFVAGEKERFTELVDNTLLPLNIDNVISMQDFGNRQAAQDQVDSRLPTEPPPGFSRAE